MRPKIFCVESGTSRYGEEDCDHDFPASPTKEDSGFAEWECTKCGMIRRYEVLE